MAKGIGNPDWQRRYVTSAVPILGINFPDNASTVSAVSDSNGFQYLMVSTNGANSTAYMHVQVNWYQDAAATVPMGITDWTIPPNSFIVIKVPIITRYYTLEMGPVGGATGHTINAAVYGTNLDQENILTQNTAIPLLYAVPNIAASGNTFLTVAGVNGGTVNIVIRDNSNAIWAAAVEYYDWTTQTWNIIWYGDGSQFGQTYSFMLNLPYAPVRMQIVNLDTVARGFNITVVAT